MATRKLVTRPVVVRAGPYMARASLECHRPNLQAMGMV